MMLKSDLVVLFATLPPKSSPFAEGKKNKRAEARKNKKEREL
jgi:hypothetical protein